MRDTALPQPTDDDETKQEYLVRMQSLQKIREAAGGRLDLPQMCVVGDQSSGKSALLSCLTGVHFPESSGICTRAPIVVQCRFSNQASDDYEISDPIQNKYAKCESLDELRNRITEMQHRAISKLKEAPPGSAEQHEANTCEDLKTPCKTISTDEICVRVSGPTQMDIIIIDLPGIIHNGDGAMETRQLIKRYCDPVQSLTLLVSEAKQDYESIEAIALAQQCDPTRERTLRVLTKFDVFDSPESRQRAENEILLDRPTNDGLASHAVVCRCDGAPYDLAKEQDILSTTLSQLPPDKIGVPALKRRLPALFSRLISANLPNLRGQVQKQLHESEQVLMKVSADPVEGVSMIKDLQRLVLTKEEFEVVLTPHLEQFRSEIASTKGRITKQFTDSFFHGNAFQISVFQGNDALLKCMTEVTTWWHSHLVLYAELVEKELRSSVLKAITASTLSTPFRSAASTEWTKRCDDILCRFNRLCTETHEMERGFGTINHYLDSKFNEGKVLPDELIQSLVTGLETRIGFSKQGEFVDRQQDYQEALSAYTARQTAAKQSQKRFEEAPPVKPPSVSVLLRQYLEEERAAYMAKYEAKGLMDQQRERLYSAVLAVWAVEHKTFVDVVLKHTRDAVIMVREDWIRHDVYRNEAIRQNAVEDDEVRQKRSEAKAWIAKMKACLHELNECE